MEVINEEVTYTVKLTAEEYRKVQELFSIKSEVPKASLAMGEACTKSVKGTHKVVPNAIVLDEDEIPF